MPRIIIRCSVASFMSSVASCSGWLEPGLPNYGASPCKHAWKHWACRVYASQASNETQAFRIRTDEGF